MEQIRNGTAVKRRKVIALLQQNPMATTVDLQQVYGKSRLCPKYIAAIRKVVALPTLPENLEHRSVNELRGILGMGKLPHYPKHRVNDGSLNPRPIHRRVSRRPVERIGAVSPVDPLKGLTQYLAGALPYLAGSDIAEIIITPSKTPNGTPTLTWAIGKDVRSYVRGTA